MRAVVVVLLLAPLAMAGDARCELAATDVVAVRSVNLAYPAAWEKNDAAAVMRLFTKDAVLLPHHGGSPVEGEAAIREHFWPEGSLPVTVRRYRMEPVEVGGCRELAYSRGRFAIELTIGSGAKAQTYSNAGTYMMIFRRQKDGEWRITHYMWDDPPPRLD